jgi:hypothetical protein
MKKYLPFVILILTIACQKQTLEPNLYQIDKDLEPFLNTFIDEAKKRGVEVKLENLIMTFGNSTTDICGQCNKKSNNGQRTITIIKDPICWTNASKQNQEALVFHELGHCLLNRLHRDDVFPNGDDVSLMKSKGNGQYEPCTYDLGGNNSNCNKTSRRGYYINELFDEKTSIPAWAK